MKKIKRIIFIMFMIVVSFSKTAIVKAETDKIMLGDAIEGPYYVVHKEGTKVLQDKAHWILRQSDNMPVYCIQPFVHINRDATYEVTVEDLVNVANIPRDDWKRIEKVAYYGYGYKDQNVDHTDIKWYPATEMLIWNLSNRNVENYFTSYIGGPKDSSILSEEMEEINRLVDEHNLLPNFTNIPSYMTLNSTITINDQNNVLSSYNVQNIKGATITKEDNKLHITSTSIDGISLDLVKNASHYEELIKLYYATDSQNVVRRGNIDPIKLNINIEVKSGKVKLNKLDIETKSNNPQGEATLEGAIYGIYDVDGNQITTIKTSKDGTVQSDFLPNVGKYLIRELESSKGYELDKNEYEFEITEANFFPIITVYEQVIRRNIQIHKYYANGYTGDLIPEENIIFQFYDKNNNMVAEVDTNKDGFASLNLPYGVYIGKQITTSAGYEKVDDFNVVINEDSPKVINLSFTNAPIKSKLRVVKIDEETGNVITKNNIAFKIYDVINEKYVCQKITYPNAETLCEFKTDENGILYTPTELLASTYRLEEVDQKIDGYLWNKNSLEFVIGEESSFIRDDEIGVIFEVRFPNKQVKGEIQINKFGDSLVIKHGNYKYDKIPLSNVEFVIKSKEDIIVSGKKYYSKDDIVSILKTDKNGFASISNLPLGKYILFEKNTNNDYILDDTMYEFELNYHDQYTPIVIKEFNINNQYKKGKLEFIKTDLLSGDVIPNTIIDIFNEQDELIYTGKTDKDGRIIINDLKIGKYYIVEKEPAFGYTITDKNLFFEIKENGDVAKVNMTNEKYIVDVPNTEENDYWIPILIILISISTCILVYEKINKKK